MATVSIITPVYNAEKTLAKCIESILSQTHRDIELILVDDGSRDASPTLCDDFAKRDQRIRVIHKENGGASAARNTGLAEAKGEYIAFVDSDDWVEPSYIENMMTGEDADVVMAGWTEEPLGGKCGPGVNITYKGDSFKDFFYSGHIHIGNICSKLLKSSIIRENRIKFGKAKVYEDFLFFLEYYRYANSIRIASYTDYHYVLPLGFWNKYKLSTNEIVWLYETFYNHLDLMATAHGEKVFDRNFALPLYFYFNLDTTRLCSVGDYSLIRETYMRLHPDATEDDLFADPFASPMLCLLNCALDVYPTDHAAAMSIGRHLGSEPFRSGINKVPHTSKANKICAYAFAYGISPIVWGIFFLKKLKHTF